MIESPDPSWVPVYVEGVSPLVHAWIADLLGRLFTLGLLGFAVVVLLLGGILIVAGLRR